MKKLIIILFLAIFTLPLESMAEPQVKHLIGHISYKIYMKKRHRKFKRIHRKNMRLQRKTQSHKN